MAYGEDIARSNNSSNSNSMTNWQNSVNTHAYQGSAYYPQSHNVTSGQQWSSNEHMCTHIIVNVS